MLNFSKGQELDISFTAEVVTSDYHDSVSVRLPDGWVHTLPVDNPKIKIEIKSPENWPPQPGDVWKTTGYKFNFYCLKDGILTALRPSKSSKSGYDSPFEDTEWLFDRFIKSCFGNNVKLIFRPE